ncbi:hypothetical protein [Methylobacterium gnaphalii]|uniref:Uncharacterized protein n=1 Tax=Methylobacterium gnaphalii TaxID=1010610 RepID=A0A512JM99_9HYPH|nr:hypothetical protein [Methylobacterium gnaphalii]GEP11095.1 hypothetical protein MGN01_29400 [Methylobacterium gnaphalii]GLS50373.1 hypothetical protein GCM10007885_32250 [Methylobacterium gnaphalii]
MPRFIFDVHDDGPAEWGDESLEGAGRNEIERRARELIAEAQARQVARGSQCVTTTVYVYHEGDAIVLTAYGRVGQDVRIVWPLG